MKKLILENKTRSYEVYQWDDGGFSINVLCGGIAEFEAEISLNQEELRQFAEDGEKFADDLAYDISRNFSKYQQRRIS